MKKILGLVALVLALGCDDGEMTFKNFNFGTGNPSMCGDSNILYKINGTEVLILDLTGAALINTETPNDQPRMITLGGSNSITYRNYDGTPNSNVICSFPAPSSPAVTEEWDGTGTIMIETDAVRNSSNIITGYSHKITLVDVSFSKDGETTRIVDNDMGSIIIPNGFTFTFGSETDQAADSCPDNNLIFRRNSTETLILDIPAGVQLPDEEAETLEIALDNLTDDLDVYFQVFDGTISDAHVCADIRPVTPNIKKRFAAQSGTLVMVAEEVPGGGLQNKIYLKNVVFTNVSTAGETFNVNDIVAIENPALGYFFGNLLVN